MLDAARTPLSLSLVGLCRGVKWDSASDVSGEQAVSSSGNEKVPHCVWLDFV